MSAERDRWLNDLAASCHSCADCWNVPCEGCMAAGVCDQICVCDDDDDSDGRDEDDE